MLNKHIFSVLALLAIIVSFEVQAMDVPRNDEKPKGSKSQVQQRPERNGNVRQNQSARYTSNIRPESRKYPERVGTKNPKEIGSISIQLGTSIDSPTRKWIYGLQRKMWLFMQEEAKGGKCLFTNKRREFYVIATQPSTDPHAIIDTFRLNQGTNIDDKLVGVMKETLKNSLPCFKSLPRSEDAISPEIPCIDNNAIRFTTRNLIMVTQFIDSRQRRRTSHFGPNDIESLTNETDALESVTFVLELCNGALNQDSVLLKETTFLDLAKNELQRSVRSNELSKVLLQPKDDRFSKELLHVTLLKLRAVEQQDYESYMQEGNPRLLTSIEPGTGFKRVVELFRIFQNTIYPQGGNQFVHFDRIYLGGMPKLAVRLEKMKQKQTEKRGSPPNKILSPKFYNSSCSGGFLIPSGEEIDESTILRLSGGGLTSFPETILSQTMLVMIDLSNNKLELIPEQVKELVNLKMLFLDNNNLKTIPCSSILQLEKLEYLDLCDNPIDENCPEITRLRDRGCRVITHKDQR